MSAKNVGSWFALLLFLTCCRDLAPSGSLHVEASPTAVRGVLATVGPEGVTPRPVLPTTAQSNAQATPIPTLTPKVAETSLIPATGTPSPLGKELIAFSGLYFAAAADAPAQDTFPPGTEEVYAIWDYTSMSPTDKIRRIWFRDDQIWLTREEEWNWGEHDSEGTMRGISVYDNEGSGLQPATYRLQLYVNDQLQQEATFVVLAP